MAGLRETQVRSFTYDTRWQFYV